MVDDFITIARVIKTQGRRGEVATELHTDFPQRFAERKRIYASKENGERRELQLESFWPHQTRYVLKFLGVDSISQAEELVGCELQIRKEDRTKLEAGSAYVNELMGCTVWKCTAAGEVELGQVAGVEFGAGEAPLLIVRQGANEHLLPFAAEYIDGLDLEQRRIRMRLPEGMLELNAPLTDEEKQQQTAGRQQKPRNAR